MTNTLVEKGLRTMQEGVLAALSDARTDGMSTSEVAEVLGIPHSASDRRQHLVKQLLFHMEREGIVEDARESDVSAHRWVAAAQALEAELAAEVEAALKAAVDADVKAALNEQPPIYAVEAANESAEAQALRDAQVALATAEAEQAAACA